jgi:hypothetical protein
MVLGKLPYTRFLPTRQGPTKEVPVAGCNHMCGGRESFIVDVLGEINGWE